MVVGLGIITFRIHECRSLKEKRRIVKSIVHQIQNNFNASVAEVGANDRYKKAEIGFALIGSDRRIINSKMDKILNMLDSNAPADIVDSELEIINL